MQKDGPQNDCQGKHAECFGKPECKQQKADLGLQGNRQAARRNLSHDKDAFVFEQQHETRVKGNQQIAEQDGSNEQNHRRNAARRQCYRDCGPVRNNLDRAAAGPLTRPRHFA